MPKSHRFTLGSLNCAALSDGPSRTMPLSATFPTVSAEDLSTAKTHFGTSTDEVEVGYHVLYIESGEQKILIDCGLSNGELVDSLKQLDVSPEDIDTIYITHGDSDHVGGMLNFPNAQFIYPKAAWDQWQSDDGLKNLNEQFLYLFAPMRSEDELKQMEETRNNHGKIVLPSLKARTVLVEAGEENIPGIKFITAPGHRTDHFAIEIHSDGEHLIHVVDSIRHPFQINYPWASFIDSFPEEIIETNKRLVELILEKQATVFGAHFPFPALAKISKTTDSNNWEWLS